MIKILDFWAFGNGWGLAAPFSAHTFYWLPYYKKDGDPKRRGAFYIFSFGLGAQLYSFQWTRPRPSERRKIKGATFAPYGEGTRRWGRVKVPWAIQLPQGERTTPELVRLMKKNLGDRHVNFLEKSK